MSVSEKIIKNEVLKGKNYFKEEFEGKEYSNLLKRNSRRRRKSQSEDVEQMRMYVQFVDQLKS